MGQLGGSSKRNQTPGRNIYSRKRTQSKSTVMQNLVYVCVGVCVLVAVSSAGRPGGNLEQYQICQDLVAQQNETLQLLQEFPCFDNVFDWFNEISGEDGGRPEKPEKPKAYIMQSGEDVETDGEGMKLFNCARCRKIGCRRVNRVLRIKLNLMQEAHNYLLEQGCPESTTEGIESTTDGNEGETTTEMEATTSE